MKATQERITEVDYLIREVEGLYGEIEEVDYIAGTLLEKVQRIQKRKRKPEKKEALAPLVEWLEVLIDDLSEMRYQVDSLPLGGFDLPEHILNDIDSLDF
jgi:hypothetical protein